MKMDVKEVKYIAKLSKLQMTEKEIEEMTYEFENILNEFQTLNNLHLEGCGAKNDDEMCRKSIREDKAENSNRDNLMSNVKSYKNGYIEVPKVIE